MKSLVLTNWQPSRMDGKTIALEFQVLLGTFGFLTAIPEVRLTPPVDDLPLDWHQDNDGMPLLLAVWSSRFSTQVRFKNNQRLKTRNGDVVLIDNESAFHRTPPEVGKHKRWFVRTSVITARQMDHVYNCRRLADEHTRETSHRVARIEPELLYVCRDCEWTVKP